MFTLWIVAIFFVAVVFFVGSSFLYHSRKKRVPHQSEAAELSRHPRQSDPSTNEAGNSIPKAG